MSLVFSQKVQWYWYQNQTTGTGTVVAGRPNIPAPSINLFSMGGIIFRPHRRRMTSDNLSLQIFFWNAMKAQLAF